MRFWRSSEERQAAEAARADCEALIARVDANPENVMEVTGAFDQAIASTALSTRERDALISAWASARDRVFREYARRSWRTTI